jgi:serine/threonine protein kinase
MSLSIGSRFGHYEVSALLGVGGMGEVYRATDTRLKRQVALKVLPSAFTADPERLARFQREAELLASLNHPNIAAIYGLERLRPHLSEEHGYPSEGVGVSSRWGWGPSASGINAHRDAGARHGAR